MLLEVFKVGAFYVERTLTVAGLLRMLSDAG
jgi:hypothetical protein